MKTGLERPEPLPTNDSAVTWLIVSGERVTIDDKGNCGCCWSNLRYQLPLVRISTGPCAGRLLRLTPRQIMRKKQ